MSRPAKFTGKGHCSSPELTSEEEWPKYDALGQLSRMTKRHGPHKNPCIVKRDGYAEIIWPFQGSTLDLTGSPDRANGARSQKHRSVKSAGEAQLVQEETHQAPRPYPSEDDPRYPPQIEEEWKAFLKFCKEVGPTRAENFMRWESLGCPDRSQLVVADRPSQPVAGPSGASASSTVRASGSQQSVRASGSQQPVRQGRSQRREPPSQPRMVGMRIR